MMKLFLAIEPGAAVKRELVSRYTEFRKFKDAKTVSDDNLHITLKFLGETEPNIVPRIKSVMNELFENMKQFSISTDKISAFPNENRASVVWANVSKNIEVIISIKNRIDEKLFDLGFGKDDHEFMPHITMVRLSEAVNVEKIVETISFKVESVVESVVLFESINGDNGVEYKKIYEKELRD